MATGVELLDKPRKKPDVAALLRRGPVMLVGRLASLTREDFDALVGSFGGKRTFWLSRSVSLVVVGQRDWPLTADGTLPPNLRVLRAWGRTHAERHTATVLSEDQFLEVVGLQNRSGLYTTAALTEVLGVPTATIRSWVRAGLIRPAAVEHGVWHFDFRQVSACKTIMDLLRRGVTLGRIRRSLEQLRSWLPEAQTPLEQLAVVERDGSLVVRLEQGDLAEADGQLRLDFEGGGPAPAPLPMRPAEPRTAGQWFDQGLEQEEAGFLAEAAESYRQALLVGGPSAETAFNLANVLRATGKREQALERYLQAVEVEPSFAAAWNNLGTLLAESGLKEQACDAFRQAIDADPDEARAHYNLADTLDEMKLAREAEPHWRAYLQHDATSRWARHALSRLRQA